MILGWLTAGCETGTCREVANKIYLTGHRNVSGFVYGLPRRTRSCFLEPGHGDGQGEIFDLDGDSCRLKHRERILVVFMLLMRIGMSGGLEINEAGIEDFNSLHRYPKSGRIINGVSFCELRT